jgi:hypothetical protein
MSTDIKGVVLIGGMPRSGTTLLANLVQQRFAIPICPETHFFSSGYDNQAGISIDGVPFEVLQDELVGGAYRSMRGEKFEDFIDGFDAFLAKIFNQQFSFIGEKTPRHLEFFYTIAAKRDNYRFIVLDRSMSEVCDSLLRVEWNNRSVFYNCCRWVRYHYLTAKLKEQFPERVQIVRYDLLCANPDLVIRKLSNRLGLHQTSQKLEGFRNYDEGLEPWKIGSSEPPRIKRKKSRFNRLSIKSMDIFEFSVRVFVRTIFKFKSKRK